MFGQSIMSLPMAAGFAAFAIAQLSGWQDGEISATLCTWMGSRVAVLRDTVYLDGGYMEWRPQLSDGSYGDVIKDTNTQGIVYTLNFSTPFNTSQNITALFGQLVKGSSGPLYYDGALLGNDDEFFLFGGMLTDTLVNRGTEPNDDAVLEYIGYSYGVDKPAATGQFTPQVLDNEVTRYIAYGGAANVPSENLAFYFSGLRNPTWGDIYYPTNASSGSTTASVVSDTLITLDLATQNEETWSNATLPDDISGRATAELVWVPVGEQGILVALGGAVYPEFVESAHYSDNMTASEDESPLFMSNIDIYDIASKSWYTQSASGGPGVALAQGCAVMQPAKDYSSFNIYWYGGYDGLHSSNASDWSDDVWILSLPSFTWKKAAPGRTGMARAGHRCVMPYPDQMLVIGGTPAGQAAGYSCVTDVIQIFNVSSAEWLEQYDPNVWSEYQVPSVVYEAIGGDESGGATSTAPARWDTSSLGDVFQTAYATSKITNYYPYQEATSTGSSPSSTSTTKGNSGGSSVPKFLAPLLGVLLGLLFLTSLVVGILVWRRRRLLKKNGGVSEMATDEHGNRIMSWINGQTGAAAKADTITTSDEVSNARTPPLDQGGARNVQHYPFPQEYYAQVQPQQFHHEVDNNQVSELPAETRAAELSDTAMSPSDIVQQRFGSVSPAGPRSVGWSSIQATDQGSLVSSTSFARNIPPAPPSSESYATSSVAGGGLPPESVISSSRQSPPPSHNPSGRPESTALPTHLASQYDAKELPATPPGDGGEPQAPQEGASRTSSPANGRPAAQPRGGSEVSAFSERERAHLRNLSDPATVSTMDAIISPEGRPSSRAHHHGALSLGEGAVAAANERARGAGSGSGAQQQQQTPSVVSPPTGSEAEGEDYVGARVRGAAGLVSPIDGRAGEMPAPPAQGAERKSAFRESDEDLGGRH